MSGAAGASAPRRALGLVLAAMLALLCLLVAYQVVARYAPFVPPFLWTEEIARLTFVWMVMAGAVAGAMDDSHFGFTLLRDRLAARLGAWVLVLVTGLSLGVYVFFAWSSTVFAVGGASRTSMVTGLPASVSYAALAVGGALMALATLARLVRLLRGAGR